MLRDRMINEAKKQFHSDKVDSWSGHYFSRLPWTLGAGTPPCPSCHAGGCSGLVFLMPDRLTQVAAIACGRCETLSVSPVPKPTT